ncbi:MAG: hypothetical protein ACI8QI_000443 [Limisphaerales bacterium]|jgi:hypothetical protein
MEQLKQHYEKAILGLAMLALVYVAYGVLTDTSEEAIEEQIQARSRPALEQKKEMPAMDMRGYHATLARLEDAKPLNLSNPHNLFNPVQWRITRQGTTLKVELGNEIGAGAIVLSETQPLYLKIEYRGTAGSTQNTRYRFSVTREAAETKKKRLRMTTTVQLNNKDTRDLFTLIKIVGDPADPTAFELQLANNAGNVTVEKGKLFQRIDGYTATLKYPPDNKTYANKRVRDKLFFADDGHNIVAIGRREVVLSTASTSKRTTIPLR